MPPPHSLLALIIANAQLAGAWQLVFVPQRSFSRVGRFKPRNHPMPMLACLSWPCRTRTRCRAGSITPHSRPGCSKIGPPALASAQAGLVAPPQIGTLGMQNTGISFASPPTPACANGAAPCCCALPAAPSRSPGTGSGNHEAQGHESARRAPPSMHNFAAAQHTAVFTCPPLAAPANDGPLPLHGWAPCLLRQAIAAHAHHGWCPQLWRA